MYLDVSEAGALAELDVVSEDRSLPISWHLRVTQVDCRSRVGFAMHALKAPPGCLQYHNLERPRGKVASLNFDLESPIAPGQNYAVCFRLPNLISSKPDFPFENLVISHDHDHDI